MGATILLVDDEPDVIEFQKAYLCRRGFKVLTATNTAESMELIKRDKPEIIFCDIRLESDTSGLDILEQTLKIQPQAVIYLTSGLVDVEIEKKGLRLGARAFLSKPLSNQEMEEKIKEVLSA